MHSKSKPHLGIWVAQRNFGRFIESGQLFQALSPVPPPDGWARRRLVPEEVVRRLPGKVFWLPDGRPFIIIRAASMIELRTHRSRVERDHLPYDQGWRLKLLKGRQAEAISTASVRA